MKFEYCVVFETGQKSVQSIWDPYTSTWRSPEQGFESFDTISHLVGSTTTVTLIQPIIFTLVKKISASGGTVRDSRLSRPPCQLH